MAQIFLSISTSVEVPFPNGFPTVSFTAVSGEYQVQLVNAAGIVVSSQGIEVQESQVAVQAEQTAPLDTTNATEE